MGPVATERGLRDLTILVNPSHPLTYHHAQRVETRKGLIRTLRPFLVLLLYPVCMSLGRGRRGGRRARVCLCLLRLMLTLGPLTPELKRCRRRMRYERRCKLYICSCQLSCCGVVAVESDEHSGCVVGGHPFDVDCDCVIRRP